MPFRKGKNETKKEKLTNMCTKMKNTLTEISQEKMRLKKELENEKNPFRKLLKNSEIAYYEDLEIEMVLRINEIENKLIKIEKKNKDEKSL